MKIKENGNNGSEIHRLKPMQENYDKETFDRMYKICKPVIRRLTKQIDNRRFNVTPDIISSYFWDKMLFVFNKYYGTCEEEHLKARILASLSTFKNHLLRTAYGEGAEYHQNLYQLEDLFDNDKELEDFYIWLKQKTEAVISPDNHHSPCNNYMTCKMCEYAPICLKYGYEVPQTTEEIINSFNEVVGQEADGTEIIQPVYKYDPRPDEEEEN